MRSVSPLAVRAVLQNDMRGAIEWARVWLGIAEQLTSDAQGRADLLFPTGISSLGLKADETLNRWKISNDAMRPPNWGGLA